MFARNMFQAARTPLLCRAFPALHLAPKSRALPLLFSTEAPVAKASKAKNDKLKDALMAAKVAMKDKDTELKAAMKSVKGKDKELKLALKALAVASSKQPRTKKDTDAPKGAKNACVCISPHMHCYHA
jgi:hypothetical protein